MTARLVEWIVALMGAIGAPGAGLAIALENVFPPIPSEVVLPLAGFAASRGEFSVVSAIVWTTLGSLAGAYALYGLGRVYGEERLTRVAERLPLLKASDVAKTVAWFHRHGQGAVFFGRMLPLFRSLISIPAGVERMGWARFGLLTGLGSLIWNTVFVLAGYLLGENWGLVERYAGVLSKLVVGAVVIAVGWFVVRRLRRR